MLSDESKEQVPSIVPHLIIAGNRSWFVPRVLLYQKQQSFFTVANMTMAQEFFVAVSFSWILVISAQATQRRLFTIILKWGILKGVTEYCKPVTDETYHIDLFPLL